MVRDPLLWKRNALVIPGGLLVAYSLLGMAYGLWLRVPRSGCMQGQVLVGGCQSVAVVLLPALVLGLALVAFGVVRFRSRPQDLEGHLQHGTGAYFTLALLGSLVLVAAAGWIWAGVRSASLAPGEHLAVEAGGVRYAFSFVMQLLLVGSLLALASAAGMFMAQNRLRTSFLAAAQASDAAPEPYVAPQDEGQTRPVGTESWTGAWTEVPPDEGAPAGHAADRDPPAVAADAPSTLDEPGWSDAEE